MRGSLLSSALLLLWPGLGCTRGRVSAFIPAIYLHLGPIAGGPVALTIDGAGLMMTKKRPFFYYLSFGLLLSLGPGSRPPGSLPGFGSVGKKDPFLIPHVLGTLTQSRFFWGVGLWWDPSIPYPRSLIPYPFIRPRSKV